VKRRIVGTEEIRISAVTDEDMSTLATVDGESSADRYDAIVIGSEIAGASFGCAHARTTSHSSIQRFVLSLGECPDRVPLDHLRASRL
jgi:hypothetical protein